MSSSEVEVSVLARNATEFLNSPNGFKFGFGALSLSKFIPAPGQVE